MVSQPPLVRRYGTAAIAEAAGLIASGRIVAVPTETVYGLAADARRADAVAAIYAAKGRPSFNPLIVHVPDLAAAERLAILENHARDLAMRFWPGPLTLVLPLRADAGIAPAVTAGLVTIAIRVPAHRAMQALLREIGAPLAAPSANASNAISPTTAAHVVASLGARVPLVIDDGPCPAGVESTIVFGDAILRPGPIPPEALGLAIRTPSGDSPTAPGQLASHYAPRKPLRLDAFQAEPDEWLIGFGPITGNDSLSATGDLAEAAAKLFAALHRADAAPSARIAVAPIPEHGIGAAIADRLRRAAHH